MNFTSSFAGILATEKKLISNNLSPDEKKELIRKLLEEKARFEHGSFHHPKKSRRLW